MWATGTPRIRDAPHASVADSSAVLAAGIDFRIVRTRPGTDRHFERERHVDTAWVPDRCHQQTSLRRSAASYPTTRPQTRSAAHLHVRAGRSRDGGSNETRSLYRVIRSINGPSTVA